MTTDEIAVLERWLSSDAAWEAGFSFAPVAYEPPLKPRRPELPPIVEGRANPIDRILDNWMSTNSVARPATITDAAFLRRGAIGFDRLAPIAPKN